MGELEEFAEALLDQIGVELDEEREIAATASRIAEDPGFGAEFEPPEDIVQKIEGDLRARIAGFTGIGVPDNVDIRFPELAELKVLKGKKVFPTPGARRFVDGLFRAISTEDKAAIAKLAGEDTARFLTYSTYAKSYISKLTTTYGDYLDSTVYLNRFILSRYPQIVLYRRGEPYQDGFDAVDSGYRGALKMTVLEEMVHAVQGDLHAANRDAVTEVNRLNEELAGIILALDDGTANELSEYLQLQAVPDDFPVARRANLFFMLNPDNFIMNVLGPDVLTFTKVEVDPRISGYVPELLDIYQRWLKPIQEHEAAFSVMEGMAEFCVQGILADDADFHEYLRTFAGTDITAYRVRKSMGRDLVAAVRDARGRDAFGMMMADPPTTAELKDPRPYMARLQGRS